MIVIYLTISHVLFYLDKEKTDDNEDPELLELLEDIEKENNYGPSISANIAEAFDRTAQRSISKENMEKLKANLKIPDNCKSFTVPKVNSEIWQNLRTRSRIMDLKLQQNQAGLSTALSALAQISDEVAKSAKLMPKEAATKILKLSMDAGNLIGSQFFDLSARRRMEIKPFLNADYAGICNSSIKQSEWLFGENMSEALKASKTAASVMKTMNKTGRYRAVPYQVPQRQQNGYLNFQRPSTFGQGRWNGHLQHQSMRFHQFQNRPRQQSPQGMYQSYKRNRL